MGGRGGGGVDELKRCGWFLQTPGWPKKADVRDQESKKFCKPKISRLKSVSREHHVEVFGKKLSIFSSFFLG